MSGSKPLRIFFLAALCGLLCGSVGWVQAQGDGREKGEGDTEAVAKEKPEAKKKEAAKEAANIAETARIALNPVPSQFELWTDAQGFSWQLTQAGSLQSGPLSYFQSAMALSVKGKSFSPQQGARLDGGEVDARKGARIVLTGEDGGIQTVRDIWFDRQRGGVRYIDSFSNKAGKENIRLTVQLKTMFRSSWQDLHGGSGRILGGREATSLNSRDHAVLVKYSRTDAHPDTVFLVAGEGEVTLPRITFSSNHRELTFTYELDIAPGQKAALVHWIVQRNLATPSEVAEALRPFYLRQRLLNPGVSRDLAKVTANFSASALPEQTVEPYSLESLVALKKAILPLGAERLWEDVLWITGENQLAGEVDDTGRIKVKTLFGEKELGIGEVAAIQGGGGVGRTPRVFLRNGQVWAGEVEAENLTMTSRDGWDMDLKIADLMFLLTRLGELDGKAPDGTGVFVALRSGDVLALGGGDDTAVEVLTPWGADRVPISEVASLSYTSGTVPKYRLHRKDGSWMSVFLSGGDLNLAPVHGQAVKIRPGEVAAIWMPEEGGEMLAAKNDSDDWLDFQDIGDRESLPVPCCLLEGSNLMHGGISMGVMHLVSGGTVTKIDPGEIVKIERLDQSGADVMPEFDVELSGGNRLRGRLRERSLSLKTSSRSWDIPVQHFIGYLGKEEK